MQYAWSGRFRRTIGIQVGILLRNILSTFSKKNYNDEKGSDYFPFRLLVSKFQDGQFIFKGRRDNLQKYSEIFLGINKKAIAQLRSTRITWSIYCT